MTHIDTILLIQFKLSCDPNIPQRGIQYQHDSKAKAWLRNLIPKQQK